MKVYLLLFAILLIKEASAGRRPPNITCSNLCTTHLATNASNYLGIWYLNQIVSDPFSNTIKCAYLNASSVVNNTLMANLHFLSRIDGKAVVEPFNIQFLPGGLVKTELFSYHLPLTYKIISTNSDYFALFVCAECGFFQKAGAGLYGAIYTRLHQAPCTTTDIALLDLTQCGIPKSSLLKHDQSHCVLC